jgi:ZZ-type zinc finger-containing protein 3
LEELLKIYPEEAVTNQRYAKIAKALGNKTTKQVASRLKVYFTKLALAGLEVPGKIPNISKAEKKKKKNENKCTIVEKVYEGSESVLSKIETINEGFYKKPKVLIEENNLDLISLNEQLPNFGFVGSNQVVQNIVYYGIVCVCCNVSPIVGNKYSCVQCWKNSGDLVNLCDDCFASEERMKLLQHPDTHRFAPCKKKNSGLDFNPEENEKQYLF